MNSESTVYITRGVPRFDCIKVFPGEWVVIKPNLVKQHNLRDPQEWESVITSADLIQAVVEFVARALNGSGRITICDAPQTDSSFSEIDRRLRLTDIATSARRKFGCAAEVLDLRNEEWTAIEEVIVDRRRLRGDPEGSIAFQLGRESLFYSYRGEGRYYGADYDSGVVNSHHSGECQEYLLCGTPIKADVFINLPKLKTHKKTGVTLSLKNLVGINADKNWLPHHTDGSPNDGGDQFPDLTFRRMCEQKAVAFARKAALAVPGAGTFVARKMRKAGKIAFGDGGVIRSGNWHGNDTTWRMVLDLNRCLLYGDAQGAISRVRPKRYYSVVDGIVGMEGNGPMHGHPVNSGVILVGDDPVAVDMVAARLMGFDWRKIPVIRNAFEPHSLPITRCRPSDVNVVSDVEAWNGPFLDIEDREFLRFRPHFGWAGHIEYESRL